MFTSRRLFVLYCLLAFLNLALQDWPLIAWGFKRLYSVLEWCRGTAWHWSARLRWDIVFAIGWLGMVQINEYAIGLVCLLLVCFGLFSRLMHWKPVAYEAFFKIGGSAGIAFLFLGGTLITLANKGARPWSGIPDYLASRAPLPTVPMPPFSSAVWPYLRFPLPTGVIVHRTTSQEWHLLAHMSRPQTIAAGPKATPSVIAQPDAEVAVWFSIGDDTANSILVLDSDSEIPDLRCVAPFTCWSETAITQLGSPISIDFSGKKSRRLFFSLANLSDVAVAKSDIIITLSPMPIVTTATEATAQLKGLSLRRPDGGGVRNNFSTEYNEQQTATFLPFGRSKDYYDFTADLYLSDEATVSDARIVFRVSASNLKRHQIVIPFHIVHGSR